MNIKKLFLLLIVLYPISTVFCQRIVYTYDGNGNRTLRKTLIAEPLTSPSMQIPSSVFNPKSLPTSTEFSKTNETGKAEMNEEKAVISENEGIVLNVFPNPNKGILKVEFSNLPLRYSSELKLFDLSGNAIISKNNIDSYTELDISRYKDGIYILRIKINEVIYDWKVIKNDN